MPAFVILEHELPTDNPRGTHWDLMLEQEGMDSLLTWALTEIPRLGATIEATQLPNHRPLYLHYEGPVSGNRGEVHRWDAGEYQTIHGSAQSPNEVLMLELKGEKLRSTVTARQVSAVDQRWMFKFA